MVQKIPLTLEIDDAALDAAQAKADKLEFTLQKIQTRLDMLAGVDPKTPEDEARRKIIRWRDGLDKIISQAKEKPPEGGNCEKHSDEWARRVAIVRALAKRHNVSDIVEDAIQQAAHELFKPPD